jgi:hypothetical protein
MKFACGLTFFLVDCGPANPQKSRSQTFRGVSLAGARRALENNLLYDLENTCSVIEQTI